MSHVQMLSEKVPCLSPLRTPDKKDVEKLQDHVAELTKQVKHLQGHADVSCSPLRSKQFSLTAPYVVPLPARPPSTHRPSHKIIKVRRLPFALPR